MAVGEPEPATALELLELAPAELALVLVGGALVVAAVLVGGAEVVAAVEDEAAVLVAALVVGSVEVTELDGELVVALVLVPAVLPGAAGGADCLGVPVCRLPSTTSSTATAASSASNPTSHGSQPARRGSGRRGWPEPEPAITTGGPTGPAATIGCAAVPEVARGLNVVVASAAAGTATAAPLAAKSVAAAPRNWRATSAALGRLAWSVAVIACSSPGHGSAGQPGSPAARPASRSPHPPPEPG